MKNQNTLIILFLAFTTSFVACKKDSTSLKSQMAGKWTISEIVGQDSDKVTPDSYFNFTSNTDDQVERNLNNSTTIGTYIVVGNTFNMSFSSGTYYCTDVTLDGSTLKFKATNDKDKTENRFTLVR